MGAGSPSIEDPRPRPKEGTIQDPRGSVGHVISDATARHHATPLGYTARYPAALRRGKRRPFCLCHLSMGQRATPRSCAAASSAPHDCLLGTELDEARATGVHRQPDGVHIRSSSRVSLNLRHLVRRSHKASCTTQPRRCSSELSNLGNPRSKMDETLHVFGPTPRRDTA